MELRGCSHFHFISVVRNGEVIKVPNISRDKKLLKFKNLGEIYDSNDSESHDSFARNPPRVVRSLALPDWFDDIEVAVKFESLEEQNEHSFGDITLKQLKETCKSRKRKKSKYTSFINVKQEENNLHHGEDEHELEETLVSWKRKLFKKLKAKRSGTTKCVYLSSDSNQFQRSPMDVSSDLVLHEASDEICKLVRVKTEGVEPDYMQPQAISLIISNDLGNATSEVLSAGDACYPDEDIRTTVEDIRSGNMFSTQQDILVQPISISVETQIDGLNGVSHEHLQTQSCYFSQESYEHLGSVQVHSPLMSVDLEVENVVHLDGTAVIDDQFPVLPVPELNKVDGMTALVTCDQDPEREDLVCDRTDAHRPQSLFVTVQGSVSGRVNDSQNLEFLNSSKASISYDGNDDLEEVGTKAVSDSRSTVKYCMRFPLADDVAPVVTFTSAAEEKQLAIHEVTVAPLNCSPGVQPCDDIVNVTELAASESYDDNKMQHPPERLLSARKMISPNIQERLCRAMNSNDFRDDPETNSCKEKLEFKKDCNKTNRDRVIFTSKGPEALDPAEISPNKKQTRKGKDEKKGIRSKGFAKGPQTSRIPRAASSCSSVQSCSQNAIEFSQQQMHDMERLAMKLVTELQSMKEIVVDALHCESRVGAKSRYTTNEVRIAVENATKVEDMVRKWVSMMTRDCNRFCKIMRLAETDASSPGKPVVKEKKIMFADEAGGSLCHVRVFEAFEDGNGVGAIASPVESQPQLTTREA